MLDHSKAGTKALGGSLKRQHKQEQVRMCAHGYCSRGATSCPRDGMMAICRLLLLIPTLTAKYGTLRADMTFIDFLVLIKPSPRKFHPPRPRFSYRNRCIATFLFIDGLRQQSPSVLTQLTFGATRQPHLLCQEKGTVSCFQPPYPAPTRRR
jgi:hypothetical protein